MRSALAFHPTSALHFRLISRIRAHRHYAPHPGLAFQHPSIVLNRAHERHHPYARLTPLHGWQTARFSVTWAGLYCHLTASVALLQNLDRNRANCQAELQKPAGTRRRRRSPSSPLSAAEVRVVQDGYLWKFGNRGFGAEEEKSDDRPRIGVGTQEAAARMQNIATRFGVVV